MNRWLPLLLVVLAACSGDDGRDAELARLEARAQNVTIIRDDFGVPHIYGKSDADAVFGPRSRARARS